MLESKGLFTARAEDGDLYDGAHLAQLIAALGPPPPEFLFKNRSRMADFWDDQGTLTTIQAQTHEKMISINLVTECGYCAEHWLGLAPIPYDRALESLETRLKDESGFLRFIRRTLTLDA